MALDIDTEEANNENLDGLDAVALDIDTAEASNETEDFAVQFGLQKDKKYSNFENLHFFCKLHESVGERPRKRAPARIRIVAT